MLFLFRKLICNISAYKYCSVVAQAFDYNVAITVVVSIAYDSDLG